LKWELKIARTRQRDVSVHRKLRRDGWRVLRIWEHQIERDLDFCVCRVLAALQKPLPKEYSAPGAKTSNLV
jgi:DNA mismatch endonuclease (patch repair protein)